MNPALAHAPPVPLVGSRRALRAVLTAVSLTTPDSSITMTALLNTGASLQAWLAQSIWVVIAFRLAVVAALLPLAALAERLGARRTHLGRHGLLHRRIAGQRAGLEPARVDGRLCLQFVLRGRQCRWLQLGAKL